VLAYAHRRDGAFLGRQRARRNYEYSDEASHGSKIYFGTFAAGTETHGGAMRLNSFGENSALMTKLARLIPLLSFAAAWPAAAQTTASWDNSGNGMLKGTYYFREVFYITGDYYGDLSRAIALYGNITFSGTGTYSMAATVADSNSSFLQSFAPTGTYSISASGYGFLSNPLSTGDYVFGLVSQQGIFIGSSTETASGFNDLFIAAPVSSPAATNATFKGSYWIADADLSSGQPLYAIGALFQLNPDGAGNLGTVAFSGYVGEYGSTAVTSTLSGVKYSFSNGAANIAFPNSSSALVSGQKYLYISPDGNFVFGGSPGSWDFFVGVRTSSGTPNFSGQYYQAGLDEDDSSLASGYGVLDTYYGALSASGNTSVGHQRLDDVYNSSAIGYTYTEAYNVKSDGTYSTPFMRYAVGAGGAIRIGSGIGPFLGINVALAAPSVSDPGSGVFIYPSGAVNAASSAPFTAGIAPGELITLYGARLADSTQIAPSVPFSTTLGNVQVMINGVAAPIYVVSPGQISAIVPYSITSSIAQIQVISNQVPSNTVTAFVNLSTPGIFTVPAGGTGYAAALHSDYSLVTTAHPAQIGETISVYLTGLGAVTPSVPDGSAGPSSPLSNTTNTFTADISGTTATVVYAGLAPGLAGLYQLNVTIPTGVTTGDNTLGISGPDSYNAEALISVGASSASATAMAAAPVVRKPPARAPRQLRNGHAPDFKVPTSR